MDPSFFVQGRVETLTHASNVPYNTPFKIWFDYIHICTYILYIVYILNDIHIIYLYTGFFSEFSRNDLYHVYIFV